jgi:hypothetical protein
VKAASLRVPSVIEQEDRNTPRSGCVEQKANSMHQASSGSAEREAVVARNPEVFGCAGARSSKVQESPHRWAISACEQEVRRSPPHALRHPGICQPLSNSQRASSSSGSRLGLLSKALPNPSIKPSPNSKPPGQRYSAVLHFLQRWPGVSPSVPAYVER